MYALAVARRLTLVGCAFSVLACGGASVDPPSPGTATPNDATPPTANYEVHEWGLVRQEAGSDALQFSGVAPPINDVPLVVLKPVLYFHARVPIELASVTVTAPAGGSILEVWPLLRNGRKGAQMGGRVEWNNVELDPEGACEPSPLPKLTDAPCTALGSDFCEVASLAVARTEEASCVRVNGTTERFLFYRGRSTTLRPPIAIERTDTPGEILVTNSGNARVTGRMLRIHTQDGETRVTPFDAPAPRTSVRVAEPARELALELPASTTVPQSHAGRVVISEAMGKLGLSDQEIAAFHDAWDATLFPPPRRMQAQLDMPAGLSGAKPVESIFYFLPEAATDDVARLGFTPAPRVVHRAIAVWAGLP